jgi:hypothetical protein
MHNPAVQGKIAAMDARLTEAERRIATHREVAAQLSRK